MKSLLTLAFAVAISTASAAEIPAGTHVLLRLEHSVSVHAANAGDGVHFRTVSPVSVDGKIVIPVGAWVSGTIQNVKRRGRQGELKIGIDRLMLPTGAAVNILPPVDANIRANRSRDSGGGHPALVVGGGMLAGYGSAAIASIWSHGEDTAVGVGLSVGVATMVATAILTRNRDPELYAGTTLDVVFDHAVRVGL